MTTATPPLAAAGLRPAARRVAAVNRAADELFTQQVEAIAGAGEELATRFLRGGRLLVAGDGAQRSDVAHVVVEFLHPVVTGKRALPALALPAIGDGSAARALAIQGRGTDVLLLLTAAPVEAPSRALLAAAGRVGMATVALTGAGGEALPEAHYHFAVPSTDGCVVQETHEVLYHVLWELVHVFLDHRAGGT